MALAMTIPGANGPGGIVVLVPAAAAGLVVVAVVATPWPFAAAVVGVLAPVPAVLTPVVGVVGLVGSAPFAPDARLARADRPGVADEPPVEERHATRSPTITPTTRSPT